MLPFTTKDQHDDYQLSIIAEACLKGDEGAARVAELCGKLKKAISEHRTHVFYYDHFLGALFSVQPKAALDAICGGDDIEVEHGLQLIEDMLRVKKKFFGVIPESDFWPGATRSRKPLSGVGQCGKHIDQG